MELRCFACGVLKDTDVKEIYTAGTELCQDELIPPLLVIECEVPLTDLVGWRAVVVCHGCFHRLDLDMWIDQKVWESINPRVLFNQLPPVVCGARVEGGGQWDPENYQGIL